MSNYGKGIICFWRVPDKPIRKADMEDSISATCPGGIERFSFVKPATADWILNHKSGGLERVLEKTNSRNKLVIRKVKARKSLHDQEHFTCLVMNAASKKTAHICDIRTDNAGFCYTENEANKSDSATTSLMQESEWNTVRDSVLGIVDAVRSESTMDVYYRSHINRMFVSFIKRHKGILLRPTGGVFFLPNVETSENGEMPVNAVKCYLQLKKSLEPLGVSLYCVRTHNDADSQQALADGAKDAFDRRMKDIESRMENVNKMRRDAVENRTGEIIELIQDAQLYSELLSFKADSVQVKAAELAIKLKGALS